MDDSPADKPYLDLVETYRRSFRTDDVAPLDVALAAILTAGWSGEPLWCFIVAPPSSGTSFALSRL